MIRKMVYTFWMLCYFFKFKMYRYIPDCFKNFEPNVIIESYYDGGEYFVVNEIDSYRYVLSYISYAKALHGQFFSNEHPYQLWYSNNEPLFYMHPNLREFTCDCLRAYINSGDESVNLQMYDKLYTYNLINEHNISFKNVINTDYKN